MKTTVLTLTAAALLAMPASGMADGPVVSPESWVPVVVLRPEGAVPLRPGLDASELVLGFVQVSDLEDGLPLRIGWYRVEDPTGGALESKQEQRFPLFNNSTARLTASAAQAGPRVNCERGLAPIDPGKCQSLGPDLQSLGVQADYQLGSTILSLGYEQSRYAAEPLHWLNQAQQVPDLSGRQLSQDSLQLNGRFRTGIGTLDLGLQLAQTDLSPVFGDQLNQGRFSISWLHGNLGGALSTRVQRLDDPQSELWGGIDLGLIWRTPWNGLLSIGARNLITSGRPPQALDPTTAPLNDSEERIPYVRYEQDL